MTPCVIFFSFQDDPTAMGWLQELFQNLSNIGIAQPTTLATGELLARLVRRLTG